MPSSEALEALERREYELALALLEADLATQPGGELHALAGLANFQLQRYGAAARHYTSALQIYFPRNSATGASAVHGDAETLAWLEELNACITNGVGVSPDDVTWTSLARLLACQLYLVTAQHEILGSYMWDYQLWTHRQPARIYEDLQREPLDIYQRLVNANYNLNVHRRSLMDDFAHVALDYCAKAAMLQFQSELAALRAAMDSHPRAVWRLYPSDLEVNINA